MAPDAVVLADATGLTSGQEAQLKELERIRDASSESAPQDSPFYCPGCGKRFKYQRECTGRPEAPHPPIDVASTDELNGDPANHTPAPASPGAF